MVKYYWRAVSAILMLIGALAANVVFAQKGVVHQLNWLPLQSVTSSEEQIMLPLIFEGYSTNDSFPHLPVYRTRVQVSNAGARVNAQIEILESVSLDGAEAQALSGVDVPQNPLLGAEVAAQRKQPVCVVSVVPIVRNATTGALEKITRFRINIQQNGIAKQLKSASFANSSKLASGDWYRFGVTQDGVYTLTPQFLEQLGIDLSTVSPSQINVYGHAYGQLPYDNSVERPDDLPVVAIDMQENGDGVFAGDDRIRLFARGPNRWTWNTADSAFVHERHAYTDTAYYFIGIGIEPAARIGNRTEPSGPLVGTVQSFDEYRVHEVEQYNFIKSGRVWYGELFDFNLSLTLTGSNFTFRDIDPSARIRVKAAVAARALSGGQNRFVITSQTGASGQALLPTTGNQATSAYATRRLIEFEYTANIDAQTFTIDFIRTNPAATGWLDYLEVNARRLLRMSGSELIFRDRSLLQPGAMARYELANAASVQSVWDVTDSRNPRSVNFTREGDLAVFNGSVSVMREYVAIGNSHVREPFARGRVTNQNLHALGTAGAVDMVIVTHPLFLPQAEELASFHRNEENPLRVEVVTIQQVYNEFSSGMRDVTAIKWLMKMLYDRADGNEANLPKYLLLFGDGSYDNRNGTNNNSNFVPTWQSAESLGPASSFTSDDYYGFLDDNESERVSDLVDIGVGRLPVRTPAEARAMVNKIKTYMERPDVVNTETLSNVCNDCANNYGSWRTEVVLVADDGDGSDGQTFMNQSDQIARKLENRHPDFNMKRMFMDSYRQETAAGGQRYPEGSEAIRRSVERGALIVNYIGHGGELGWANERILDIGMVQNWNNLTNLPLFVTATCQFSRFDDPVRTSAGELVLLNPNGGGVALVTTTRLVYISYNFNIANSFYDHALIGRDDASMRLGDILRLTKLDNAGSTSNNHMNFALLGDPALRLAFPKFHAETLAITDTSGAPVEQIRALDVVRISGQVLDAAGNPVTNYTGILKASLFDKKIQVLTNGNDGITPFEYRENLNVIYRGNAQIVDGQFSLDLLVPRDIDFRVDTTARISYYLYGNEGDGAGHTANITVGGINPNAPEDDLGPELNLFMNDENFVNGGYTDENPILLAKVFDESGINTVGSGIGHDFTAVLNGNSANAIVLNDYFETDLNTYKSGQVQYPFSSLPEGEHSLRVKVWDAINNSSETSLDFIVANSEDFALQRVLNYPNPFTTNTAFYFEHNQGCEFFNVQVQVYTVSGRLVKTINTISNADGFRNEAIYWDGRDDFGDKLARGVYVYRITARNPEGETADKMEKLVILK